MTRKQRPREIQGLLQLTVAELEFSWKFKKYKVQGLHCGVFASKFLPRLHRPLWPASLWVCSPNLACLSLLLYLCILTCPSGLVLISSWFRNV